MKKVYLYATALSLAFTSCSSDAWVEDDLTPTAVYKTAQPSSLIDLITTIESDCTGITYSDTKSMITAFEGVAFQNRAFQQLAQKGYRTPKVSDWEYLLITETASIISGLNYSANVKKQAEINITKNAYAFGTLKNLYPDDKTAKYLTDSEKRYLDKLFNIVIDNKLSATDIKRKVKSLESEINADKSLNNTQLATLYSATNTAKFSVEYWEENTEKWIILGGGNPAVTTTACCGDGVAAADVGGAVGAAVSTWMANAAPGAGQIAYGGAIVGGAAAASVGKAIENLLNSWF